MGSRYSATKAQGPMDIPVWVKKIEEEQNDPNSSWISQFKSENNLRMKAHSECRKTGYLPIICDVCRSVDFEYLFFGALDNGFRHSMVTHVFIGLLSDVESRAHLGCPFCRHILLSEVRRILEHVHKQRSKQDGLFGLESHEISVWLAASDVEALREEVHNALYGVAHVKISPALHHDLAITPGSIVEDFELWTSPPSRPLRLVDHQLSRSLSLECSPNLQQCRQWFEICQNDHADCIRKVSGSDQSEGIANREFKLIDLLSHQIVVLGDAEGLSYATLSYVCGKSSTLWKLPKASKLWTLDANGVPKHPLPATLPSTIFDAMTVVSSLGLRYLWVDSFCITQDDQEELQKQIRAMYQIYTRASICLVACSGENSHSGLPGISQPRSVDHRCQVKVKEGLTVGMPQPTLSNLLDEYKWMNRAWTYQELILSNRCLLFTEREVFFFCASMTYRESHQGPTKEQWARSDSLYSNLIGNATVIQNTGLGGKAGRLYNTYFAAVDEYSRRELSYQTDGLNAFQGLSILLGRMMGSQMMFGCPRNMLVNCLTWQKAEDTITDNTKRRMLARPEDNDAYKHLRPLFPSWAWVGWEGQKRFWPVRRRYFSGSEMQIMDPCLVPPIVASPSISYNFMTSDEETKESHHTLQGILPVFTKTAQVRVALHPNIPFVLEVQTSNGEWAGEINIAGGQDKWDSKREYGQCIQLFADPNKEWVGVVCLLLVEPCLVSIYNGYGGEEHLKKALLETQALKTAEPLTAQRMEPNTAFGSYKPVDCPPDIDVTSATENLEHHDLLLASRIGFGFSKLGAWIEAKPADAIVLLG